MRKQYHFRPSPSGYYAWDVHKLVELSRDIKPIDVPLADITELDENWWYEHESVPTPRNISEHIILTNDADLSYPIILCAEGRVMDGMHRCVKALLKGDTTIRAIQFAATPEPDYADVQPDELPYD